MNRIILIGNGFDKAHGLMTGYKDFIDDLSAQVNTHDDMWSEIMAIEKTENVDFKDLMENENNFKNKFFYAVKKDLNVQNWVDVEKVYCDELVVCMKNAGKTNQKGYTIKELNQEFGFLEKKLKEYLLVKVVQKDEKSPEKKQPSIEMYFDRKISKNNKFRLKKI